MDRLAEWQLFVGVATARSFASAARSLGRSPQAATRAVAALERRLGLRLFHRTTRSVTLTGDGERVLLDARHALAEMDRLEQPADTTLRGTLAITAPVLFGQLHVLPLVTTFLAEHGEIDVRLALLDRVVSLAEEGIDVAVRIGELPDSSLRARMVGHVRTVTCASPGYLARARAGKPRTLDALAHHDCISFLDGGTWSFGRRRVRVRSRLTTTSGQAAIDAALHDLGIVRALSYQVAAHLEAGSLVALLKTEDSPPLPVHLVQLPGVTSRAASAFVERATGALREALLG